jgi:hypothetical protein
MTSTRSISYMVLVLVYIITQQASMGLSMVAGDAWPALLDVDGRVDTFLFDELMLKLICPEAIRLNMLGFLSPLVISTAVGVAGSASLALAEEGTSPTDKSTTTSRGLALGIIDWPEVSSDFTTSS